MFQNQLPYAPPKSCTNYNNIEIYTSLKYFNLSPSTGESQASQRLIDALKLEGREEGGYFVQTGRCSHTVPNPFSSSPCTGNAISATVASSSDTSRCICSIYLTPHSSVSHFHRNK